MLVHWAREDGADLNAPRACTTADSSLGAWVYLPESRITPLLLPFFETLAQEKRTASTSSYDVSVHGDFASLKKILVTKKKFLVNPRSSPSSFCLPHPIASVAQTWEFKYVREMNFLAVNASFLWGLRTILIHFSFQPSFQ